MGRWLILLGGLLTWAAHFFSLFIFASIFPGNDLARWLTVAATVVALTVDGAIIGRAVPVLRSADSDQLDRWTWQFGLVGALLSFVAVLWQGLPALI